MDFIENELQKVETEFKTVGDNVKDFCKRHTATLIVIAIAIIGIFIFISFKSGKQEKLDNVYKAMAVKEQIVKAGISDKYQKLGATSGYIDTVQKAEVELLRHTPDYYDLQKQVADLENAKSTATPFQSIFLAILGMIVCAVIAGIEIFAITKIKFTQSPLLTAIVLIGFFLGNIYLFAEIVKTLLN